MGSSLIPPQEFFKALEIGLKKPCLMEYTTLTPKGPTCLFWQHRNFGQVHVTRDFHISG